jgi:hypothetical protein
MKEAVTVSDDMMDNNTVAGKNTLRKFLCRTYHILTGRTLP